MVMKPEEILQQLEEIEDHMETAKRLGSPPTGWHDTAWLCQVVRELLARKERLEAVAEAARKVWGAASDEVKEDMWFEMPPDWEGWEELERALAALEEGRE